MRTVTLITLLLWMVSACDSGKNEYSISGTISGYPEGPVILKKRTDSKFVTLDSTNVQTGHFVFTGRIELPEMYFIFIHDTLPYIRVFVENANINLQAHVDSLQYPRITGSTIQSDLDAFNRQMKPFDDSLRIVYKKYLKAYKEGDLEKTRTFEMIFDHISDDQKEKSIEFVAGHSNSVLGPYLVWGTLAYDLTLEELEDLDKGFSPEIKASIYTKQIEEYITILKKVSVGQPYTDIEMRDPRGNLQRLSELKGKLVLVDFWASWCGPCRRENPNVVALYREFRDRNFEIFGVSFDTSEEKWKQAIEEDGLIWKHVSDLRGWDSEAGRIYGVRSIPHTVLISPEGIIIEKNLRGEALRKKVEELLKG